MSIFGEFKLPTDALALHRTFATEPELVVDIDRVVAADEEYLTPYFTVSGLSADAFEAAAQDDESIEGLRQVSQADSMAMYRAQWRERVDTLAHAYTRIGASILKAKGTGEGWVIRMRFDDRGTVRRFTEYLNDQSFSFRLMRLHELGVPRSGTKFGLTPKQHEALVTAWELGYFDLPRTASMEEVAGELDITAQSLSDRLRRAQHTLIGDTLRVTADLN